MPTVNLDDAQKAQVRAWLEQGLQLGEIQKRLETDFGIRTTYLDVKLLVSDLQVLPKDPEPRNPLSREVGATGQGQSQRNRGAAGPQQAGAGDAMPSRGQRVAVSVDQLTRPGAVVSGSVTFSDGKTATWYIDELTGRFAIAPTQEGYRPSSADMSQFQLALEQALAQHGF